MNKILYFIFGILIFTMVNDGYTAVKKTAIVSTAAISGNATNSAPGNWRPFADNSPWNTTISVAPKIHPDSQIIMTTIVSGAKNIRFANVYAPAIWFVNSDKITRTKIKSDKIFDTWDKNKDSISDTNVPVDATMWGEPTDDGHISIIDLNKNTAWEMSSYKGFTSLDSKTKLPMSTTFNLWDMKGLGYGNSAEGVKWWARGGRGSGFPIIAGLLRPEEVLSGEIKHALAFTFEKNRMADDGKNIFINPACRSDGKYKGKQYPIEGMRFQLDPKYTDKDFTAWGLDKNGKVLAVALQKYGMFLADNGGSMALQVQLLGKDETTSRAKWESMLPGFYDNIQKIKTDKFRVIYTSEPITK